MARLYLIRHGRPASTWGGDEDDPGLDAVGQGQARAVADRLLALPAAERPTGVVSSPLRRCRQTAQPLADALGAQVQIESAVGEIPTPAALPRAARAAWLREALAGDWSEVAGDLDYDRWRREVLAAVAGRPGCAVFSHFVAINAVLSLIAGDDRVIGFRPDHTSVTTLEVGDGPLAVIERGREAETGIL
ncbi:MAG: histidine phosphatase family protein [Caulobacteraceae bacterium]